MSEHVFLSKNLQMRKEETMKREIIEAVRTASVPQARILYAYAYARITRSRDVPRIEVGCLVVAIEELLRMATAYEIEMIHKCAEVITKTKRKA
jgi:hypothetical protein